MLFGLWQWINNAVDNVLATNRQRHWRPFQSPCRHCGLLTPPSPTQKCLRNLDAAKRPCFGIRVCRKCFFGGRGFCLHLRNVSPPDDCDMTNRLWCEPDKFSIFLLIAINLNFHLLVQLLCVLCFWLWTARFDSDWTVNPVSPRQISVDQTYCLRMCQKWTLQCCFDPIVVQFVQ